MKIDVFDYPTVVWRPLARETLRISAQTLCRKKLESMAYISVTDSMGLSSFIFCGGLRKTHLFWNRMRFGRSRSSMVVDFGTNWKGVCDFVLVINSNFGRISCTVSEIRRVIAWKLRIFPTTPLFDAPVQGESVRISGWNLPRKKLEGWGYCENCMILTSAVFAWITRVTDGQTDSQTDGRNCDSICALTEYMLSRAKNLYQKL